MHLSRSLAALSAALLLAAAVPQLAQAREIVGFSDPYSSGTVVVKTNERALYYVLGSGKAVRYPVGVGRAGKQWTGNPGEEVWNKKENNEGKAVWNSKESSPSEGRTSG